MAKTTIYTRQKETKITNFTLVNSISYKKFNITPINSKIK